MFPKAGTASARAVVGFVGITADAGYESWVYVFVLNIRITHRCIQCYAVDQRCGAFPVKAFGSDVSLRDDQSAEVRAIDILAGCRCLQIDILHIENTEVGAQSAVEEVRFIEEQAPRQTVISRMAWPTPPFSK